MMCPTCFNKGWHFALPPGPSVGKKPDLIRPDLPPGWVIGPRIEDFLRDDWFVEPRDG